MNVSRLRPGDWFIFHGEPVKVVLTRPDPSMRRGVIVDVAYPPNGISAGASHRLYFRDGEQVRWTAGP